MYQSKSSTSTKPVYFTQTTPVSPALFTLENPWIQAVFTDAGAALCQLGIRKKDKSFQNIALGFQNIQDYLKNSLCAGSVLGPAAGRIQNGRMEIDGNLFSLTRNEGGIHHLHGGFHGLSNLLWNVQSLRKMPEGGSLAFSVSLKDGTDGYPGNRSFYACYTLERKTLRLSLSAMSDQDTFFNLSSHTYFNLNWGSSESAAPDRPCPDGLNQYLTIPASQVVYNTKEHIPHLLCPVKNTAFDFRKESLLCSKLEQFRSCEQVRWARGLNHAFLLDSWKVLSSSLSEYSLPSHMSSLSPSEKLHLAAVLRSKDKQMSLRLFTDAPCLVVYSGGFMDSSFSISHRGGWADSPCSLSSSFLPSRTFPGCAVALEAQDIPDTPNQSFLPFRITKAGETFFRQIEYHFEF